MVKTALVLKISYFQTTPTVIFAHPPTQMPVLLSEREIREEYELIKRAQIVPEAFGVLYERYYKSIFTFIDKRVGNRSATGDLVSQVFLKALINLPKYEFKGLPFSAWLYRVAVNQLHEYFRQSKNERTVNIETTSVAKLMEDVETAIPDRDAMELLIALLDQLDDDEVAFVELRYFEQLPFRETAFILGISENNAKVRMHRILTKMRNMLPNMNK